MKSLFVLLFFLPVALLGQEKQLRKISMLAQLNVGMGYSVGALKANPLTDGLIYYNGKGVYASLFYGVFYKEKWGVCFDLRFRDVASKNFGGFNAQIESQYPTSDYYINYSQNKRTADKSLDYDPSIQTTSIGVMYNYGSKKLWIIPKLMVGLTEIVAVNRYVEIKKKNSNEYIQTYYEQNTDQNAGYLTVSMGCNLVYLLYRGIGLNLEVNYANIPIVTSPITYNITTVNSLDNIPSYSQVTYRQLTGQFNVGIGLSFYIRMFKKQK